MTFKKDDSLLKITARAHANIALVKYWGKANEKLILPQTSSLSLTLNRFYTDTTVQFDPRLNADRIVINHRPKHNARRVVKFLDLVRRLAHLNAFARINSVNHVPTAAGLGSSASGFAALAAAASRAAGLRLNGRDLSRLARRGSGSATRSVYGGWVEWRCGTDRTSYARPLNTDSRLNDVCAIAMITRRTPKKIGSRRGMRRCVRTSPYYSIWRQIAKRDLKIVTNDLKDRNFTQLGRVTEANAMRMHALTLSAWPPFTYFNGTTLKVLRFVKHLRKTGLECYSTIDAGPNVIIICQQNNVAPIKARLTRHFTTAKVVASGSGPGVKLL